MEVGELDEKEKGRRTVFIQWHTVIGEYVLSDASSLNTALARSIIGIYDELGARAQGPAYPMLTHVFRERGFAALDVRPYLDSRLREFLRTSVSEYLSLVTRRPIDVSDEHITSIWPNVSQAGQLHRPHRHDCTEHVLVGTYFVAAPPPARGEGALCLLDPRGIVGGSAEYRRLYNEGEVSFAPEPGKLILFPPHIMHYVAPHTSDVPRISMSFNISAKVLHTPARAGSAAEPRAEQQVVGR